MEKHTEVLRGRIETLHDQIAPQIEDVKARARAANHRVLAFIKEQPGICLIGALAIGYVVGRIVRAKG